MGKKQITNWENYAISLDMLHDADSVTLRLGPVTRELYELAKPDTPIEISIDGTVLVTGFIDDRSMSDDSSGSSLSIRARDKAGRLIDESMPLGSFTGLGIKELAELVAGPWFDEVVLFNTTNRKLVRGSKRVAGVSKEPAIDQSPRPERKVVPGEFRLPMLQRFLERAHLMAWSTADGRALVVGLPNDDQEPQYRFFVPSIDSSRRGVGRVESVVIDDSVAERYSKIVAMGAGKGNDKNYGPRVTKHRGVAVNGPGPDGIGKDFQQRKVLLISDDDIRSPSEAQDVADREMALRDSKGAQQITITVAGHSQFVRGEQVLFAFDTMCEFEHETTGIKGNYLITAVEFRRSRSETSTMLKLVPKGTVFV